MTMSKGHAGERERARMEELEENFRGRGLSDEETLELALLNIEPGHDGFRAVELLFALEGGVYSDLASLWLAYCYIYEMMDPESLHQAAYLCGQLLVRQLPPELRAAALLLSATAARQSGKGPDPVPQLLESICLAPRWVSNRQLLARVYEDEGDRVAAEEQLRIALEVSRSSSDAALLTERLFEALIAGQGSPLIHKRLQDQIRKVAGTDR